MHWFEDDAHLGIYSVQFTATDSYAWPGIEGTKKCEGFEGICHPLYIFHRRGYDIVLKTWGKSFLLGCMTTSKVPLLIRMFPTAESQGRISDCQYKKNCGGLCQDRIKDQFSAGGKVWAGKCAVPCKEDGPEELPSVILENPRIMVAGDSISHGMEDDFTWRLRLFAWSKSSFSPTAASR